MCWFDLSVQDYTSVDPKQFKQTQIETCDLVKYLLEGLDELFFFALNFFFRIAHEGSQANTTSEPKKAAAPSNTKAARSKVALRTPAVNCLFSIRQRAQAAKTDAWQCETPACTNSHNIN